MKHLPAVIILVLACNFTLLSQDLIYTSDGDSINCKITKVSTDHIYFTFVHKEEVRSTLIPVSNIESYQYDFYAFSEVPEHKIIGQRNFDHLRLSINGGYSYLTGKIGDDLPNDIRNHIKKLKNGYHFGGDITYYFSEPLGFGFKGFFFKTINKLDNIYITDPSGIIRHGSLSEDLLISFIGPLFSTRLLNAAKSNALIMNIGVGYMGYSNETYFIDRYLIKGSSVGISYEIGYDIGISENLSLGFQASYIIGTLLKYTVDDGTTVRTVELEKGSYENMSRLDISVGIRLNK